MLRQYFNLGKFNNFIHQKKLNIYCFFNILENFMFFYFYKKNISFLAFFLSFWRQGRGKKSVKANRILSKKSGLILNWLLRLVRFFLFCEKPKCRWFCENKILQSETSVICCKSDLKTRHKNYLNTSIFGTIYVCRIRRNR